MIDDNYIKENLFTKQGNINSNYIKPEYLSNHPELKEYLEKRYPDSKSYGETIYRIQAGIETRPVCPICGGEVAFDARHRNGRGRNGWPFLRFCSTKCMSNSDEIRTKKVHTCTERYGASCAIASPEVRESARHIFEERYGVDNPAKAKEIKDKIKETFIEKYGVEHPLKTQAVQDKIRKTNIERYGVPSYAMSVESKQRYRKNQDQILQKMFDSKRRNNTFNTSSKETYLFERLSLKFDVVQQYKSDEYPYACDFYIPSLNLYIELNFSWTHGKHPYDKDADQDLLETWKKKAETSKYYENAIYTWTNLDVKKIICAKTNKLNYLVIYAKFPLERVTDFIYDNFDKTTTDKQLVIGTK